ncbi:hypothetical protein ACP6EK_05090 [Candidatus Caldatribacterium sp. SIUC1]|uniref:hypothetical protein n=1 Tax=Candidatus Caldatribacterium sp. SIUC1 TaxID=3418365 RepID=UPI003F690B61
MRREWLLFIVFPVFLCVVLAGCGGTPGPSPASPTPGTAAPGITIVREGSPDTGRVLQSGDPVRFSQDVYFQGIAPSSAVVKVYLNGTVIDQTSALPSGEFLWRWNSGVTEGIYEISFTATQGSLPESGRTTFTIVVDGTGPYLHSLSAKADAPLGNAPTIVVYFNEEIVVGDMNVFALPAVWSVTCLICPGGSVFNVTQVALSADRKSVTLTGNWITDRLIVGDQIQVFFAYVPLMGVTDKAGNPFNAALNVATGVVTP